MVEMNNRKENIQEYLSKDILEDNFVNTFLYIYRLQFALGSSRVVVKNRFVTPPTKLHKCYTILCVTLTFGSVYGFIRIFRPVTDVSFLALGLSYVLSIFVTSFCNVIHVRFFNNRQNSEFLVKMQKLDRLIKIEKNKPISSDLKRINIVSMLLIIIILVSLLALAAAVNEFEWAAFIFTLFSILPFVLELIACSSLVVYFLVRVRLVNFILESYLRQEENVRNPIIVMDQASFKWIRFAAQETAHFTTSDIHIHLAEIFRCFMTFQDLYRFQLLLFCMKLVVSSLISFEMAFYSLRQNIFAPTKLSGNVTFQVIDFFIAVYLAIRFEDFHSEVKETKRLCINVMALHQEGPLREKARSMLKMIEEAPPRFSVYDMWEMNAGMFVTIFSLVTGLIVTLIQFTI